MALLLSINVAGVKWVIRLQFILLFFLLLAAIDFVVGVFTRHDEGIQNLKIYLLIPSK